MEEHLPQDPRKIDSFTPRVRVFFAQRTIQIVENDNVKSWKLTLAIMTASALLMSASYTMLIPFLPMYLIQELNVAQEDVNLWSGVIFSISFAISGIMAPIWGAMADKKSRKLMAVRAAVCLAIAYVLGGMVQDAWQLFWVRVFQGFASGLWPACLAILTVSVPRVKLGFCLGLMQGASTAGGVLGPLLGGVLAEAFGMRAAFYLGGVGLFIITLLIIFYIKEPPRKKEIDRRALFHAADNKTQKDTLAAQTAERVTDALKAGHASGNTRVGETSGEPNAQVPGRTVLGTLASPSYTVQEAGTVVVEIWVDRNGKVTRANPGIEGTTVTDKTLWEAARKVAMQAQFNMKADAPEQQKGKITYIFDLK